MAWRYGARPGILLAGEVVLDVDCLLAGEGGRWASKTDVI